MSKTLLTQSESFKLSPDITFLGLYGSAVTLALEADFSPAPTLCIAICPSSLKRHAPGNAVDSRYVSSLPGILEQVAWGELIVHWQTPNPTARTEALELCLAALALDWRVQLSCADSVLPLLTPTQTGVKGFLSLPMFGLDQLIVSQAAALWLSDTALVLPWQLQSDSIQRRVVL